ncbi:hypothetical protein ANCDUO_03210 [Ancylostoma duodenale]|uniref:SXP/RAL-2 family protein Ani s 5-like cation-binding domain-containing protein n=1 Tax=Ancylostoma duodenale TaxID=51022 RepID=A0A0C2DUI0_9BILA|nr:hypothetical protein ANCDUO_03210 [Ancylostoma duodenale]
MWVIVIAVAALYASTEAKIYYQIPYYTSRPFLYKVPLKAAHEFHKLITAKNIPHIETREKVLEWGEKYGIKEELQEFYNKHQKDAEERGKKVIALLENAAKAYGEYLALYDDTKTLEQIDKDQRKMREEKPKEYIVFTYASQVAQQPYNNMLWVNGYSAIPGSTYVLEI